jgi:hypothetical protein
MEESHKPRRAGSLWNVKGVKDGFPLRTPEAPSQIRLILDF